MAQLYKNGKVANIDWQPGSKQYQSYIDQGYSAAAPSISAAPTPSPVPSSSPVPTNSLSSANLAAQYRPLAVTPPPMPIANPPAAVVSQTPVSPVQSIQKVFGSNWKPAPAFTPELQAKGIYGAVRIAGQPNVYTLGPGGGVETAASYAQKFGTSNQQGIVGEVTAEQARALGINPNTPMAGAGAGAVTSAGSSIGNTGDLGNAGTKYTGTPIVTGDTYTYTNKDGTGNIGNTGSIGGSSGTNGGTPDDIMTQFKTFQESMAKNQEDSSKKVEDLLTKMGEDTTNATLAKFQEMQKGLQDSYNTYFAEQTKYLDELKNQPSAVDNLQKFREQQGLPQMEAQLAGVDQTILSTEGLLANIETDIRKRTEGLPVSEAAARRLTAMEQAPLTKQMDELLRSRQRVAAGLQAKQATVEEFMNAQASDIANKKELAQAKLGIGKEAMTFKQDIATQGFEMFTGLQDSLNKINELKINQVVGDKEYKNTLASQGFDFYSQLRAEKIAKENANTTFENELVKIKLEADLQKQNPEYKISTIEDSNGNISVISTDPNTGKSTVESLGKLGGQENTADQKDYLFAKTEGYKGTYNQWLKEQANLKDVAAGGGVTYKDMTLSDGKVHSLALDKAGNIVKDFGATNKSSDARVDKIASQFDGETIVKNYTQVADGYQFVKSIDNNTKNSADNQGLIYAFAKAMDPTSVVREGEYATVQKYSQSWLESFGFNAARVVNNQEFLTPQAIQNIKDTVKKQYDAKYNSYKNLYQDYGRRIDNITGGNDGTSYVTDYAKAYDETTQKIEDLWGSSSGGSNDVWDFSSAGNASASKSSAMRTDRSNNPTAMTTDVAKTGGLVLGVDYEIGDPFPNNPNLHTAVLIGNPVDKTIQAIDNMGFYTASGKQRWTHTAMSKSEWNKLSYSGKAAVVKKMYNAEGNKGMLNKYFA